ncbi:MAG: ATP-dependent helicase/nuclease subunit B [Ulvibacter sp.]|jgi:ATP-dependent helicase/nuclease subunit B
MKTFLEETILTIKEEHSDLAALTLILPSKRAGGFLKNYLRQTANKTSFAPTIISIEEFIEELSDLKIIDTTELLFKSYNVYLTTNPDQEKDDFETYTSWATTIIGDFNEIDRYLIDPGPFFNYLSSIQDVNHWNVSNEKTPLVENYLKFWNSLNEFYERLKTSLLMEGLGYQGLVYRKASEDIEHYINNEPNKKHVFIGFNALNNAEQSIFQELLEHSNTSIYWDIEAYLFDDNKHSASYFLNKYISDWKYYQANPPNKFGNYYQEEKQFQFVEVQKNVGQAKYVGELLSKYSSDKLNKTAIVLADEKLLIPIINSLPTNIGSVNITMGVPISTFQLTTFFELLLASHLYPKPSLYYKDVLSILNQPAATLLIPDTTKIIGAINSQNISHLTLESLHSFSEPEYRQLIEEIFGNWQNDSTIAISNCLHLLELIGTKLVDNPIEHSVSIELYQIFSKISSLDTSFSYLNSIKTVSSIFSEISASTSLDFKGDAYNGLQIMGILETRVLDFENVIITSVNEGVLPAGKSNTSFITHDLKHQFGLPKYTEKDAIYTYHFYHLLHRSKSITLLYNNQSDGINASEKSRFIYQLEIEKHPNHSIDKIILAPQIKIENKEAKSISKTENVMARLKEISKKGFSPSALSSYVRNPIDFYFQKILKVSEFEEVEEMVAANTLGTIVHDTLEAFYKPLESSTLSLEILSSLKKRIHTEVKKQFEITFKKGTIDKGQNLIIFEVAKRYISNFINFEIAEIKAGNTIKIIQIEATLEVPIQISELDFPVKIGGKVDRVDEYNGHIRIIDYKTGNVEQSDLAISNWALITTDYRYSKAMQVLMYVLMINQQNKVEQVEAGIISFKNLKNGFLKFSSKTEENIGKKLPFVTQETLASFIIELKRLILEICNSEIPFNEKEIN